MLILSGTISHQAARMWRSGVSILVTLTVGFSFGFFLACFIVSIITTLNGLMLSISAVTLPCEEYEIQAEVSLAETLSERARVLCWVLTMPENHHTKAQSVKDTWGPRCNILLFMSSQNDTSLPAIGLPVREGRDYLWGKTKEAFKYVYENHLNDADWFFKADDDTYVIVENLRFLLSGFKTAKPLYFGCKFKLLGDPDAVKQGYMSGGAGYVLSKEALRRFVENGISNPEICQQGDYGTEDVEVGKCMENLGVKAVDTRDSLGRGRFFPFIPEQHLTRNHSSPDYWFWEVIYHPYNEGPEWVSDTAISFHYVSPAQMHILDYFVYRLKPVGITQKWDLNASPDTPES